MATAVLHSWRTQEARGRLRLRPASAPLRMRIWLHREELLGRLAAGEEPAAAPELTALAAELAGPRRRQALAAGFESLLGQAERRPAASRAPCPPNRHEVQVARSELELLVRRLRDGAPAQVRGLAMAEQLLCDPSNPLLLPSPRVSGWRLARNARVALDAAPVAGDHAET